MPNHPIDSKYWQNSYTEKQAFADSLQRVGTLMIPIMITLMIPLLFSIFLLVKPLENVVIEGLNARNIFGMFFGGSIGILAIITTVKMLGYLIKNAETFLINFYNLPDTIDAKELVSLRIFGRPPMPPPLSSLIKFPIVKAKNGKLDPEKYWLTIIGGPVKLKIEPGNAIYLERGNRFSRVVGQGESFLELYETIRAVLSTGLQSEEISVTAWTREGIRIRIKAKGEFFLGSTIRNNAEEGFPLYSYNPEATRKAVVNALSSGKECHEWSKSAQGITIGLLSEYISGRYLEEIFIASVNGSQLLSTSTMNDLLRKINDKLQKSGVCLTNLQIMDMELPEQVNHQRIKLWESGHKTHATVTESQVKAYQLSSQKKALAEMIRDMVFTLANGLERMDSTNLTEKLISSIYGVVNQGMSNRHVHTSSGPNTMPDGLVSFTLDGENGIDQE